MLACTLLLLAGTAAASPLLDTLLPKYHKGNSDPALFRYYDNPDFLQGPCDISDGVDGKTIWTQNFLDNSVSKIDIETGHITNYPIPYSPDQLYNASLPLTGRVAFACAIRAGKDGYMYAATGIRSQFLKIHPETGFIKVFTPPAPNIPRLGNIQPFNDLWPSDTGMWYTLTTAGTLYHFNYASETFDRIHPLPTPLNGVVGVYVDSLPGQEYVWLAEMLGGKITRFDPRRGTFRSFPLPLTALGIVVVRAETAGRYIWFTGFLSNANVRFDTVTEEIKVFADPGGLVPSLPTENTVDMQGRLWYSTAARNSIQFIEGEGETTVIEMADNVNLGPVGLLPGLNIAIHYGPDNAIYFSQVLRNRIGRYQLEGGGGGEGSSHCTWRA